MSWWSTIGTIFSGLLRALAIVGAYMAGRQSASAERAKRDADAARQANTTAEDVRSLSDAELDERLRKFTRE